MTFFDEISGNSKLIQDHNNTQLLNKISDHITSVLKHTKEPNRLPQGIIKYLTFDLSYILFRHQAWHYAPLFSELTIDHLGNEFRLPRSVATELVESSLDIFIPYLSKEKGWLAETYDREFLFDLFVASATAKNESQLRTDIGFGNSVILLFQSAAQLVQDIDTGIYSFTPEITQTILDIMQDIALEAESRPWIMDLYRLRLITSQQRLSQKKRITRSQLHQLFQILCRIGWQGIRHTQLAEYSQKYQDQTNLDCIQVEAAEVDEVVALGFEQALHLLNQYQLIYRHHLRGEDYYHLSSAGLDLTADCLAKELLATKSYDLKSLPGLPAAIQAKIVSQCFQPDQDSMEQFLKVAHRLAPEAIEILVTSFAGTGYTQQVLELLQKLLHNNQNAWARVKMMKALTNTDGFTRDQVLPLLKHLTTGDPSPMVRKTARDMHDKISTEAELNG